MTHPFKKAHKAMKKNRYVFWASICGGIVLFLGIYAVIMIKTLPSLSQLPSRQVAQSTKLYDRTGETLLYEIHNEEKRTIISFDQIPETLKKATLAAEDAGFYSEPAFDWRAIGRALLTNLKRGTFSQGGSTISQQLVKNIFLSSEKTISRKIKELILAVQLESQYSKDEILNLYLNQIPYGSNAYGVEAASQTYFNKSAKDLTLTETATLASLPKAPSYYTPWGSHLNELILRKEYVLDRMKELNFISQKERDNAKKEKLTFMPQSLGMIKAPHFSLAVKEYLINRYGEDMVENGGLKVITTLDWNLQQIAEKAIEEGTKRNEEVYGANNGALVAEDPQTGQIISLVGSRDYFDIANEGNFNVPMQGMRQPGSALKPFVYMTAFQKGYSPETILHDVSTEFDLRGTPETSYRPENFDGKIHGPVAMKNALPQSLNIPAVKTLYLAGFDDVLKNLHAFGITTLNERWRYGLSLTLGGGEVKLVDLVNAFGTMSQEGIYHTQSIILEVKNARGDIIEEYRDQNKKVADPQAPRLINHILSDPSLRAPIFGSSLSLTVFPDHEVALKTGTSEDHRDAWTIGYTPSLVVGVWAGNNDNSPMMRQGSSILAAVPIWNLFLKEALLTYPPTSFIRPDPVIGSDKPMMNGQAEFNPIINGKTYPQIHDILFYVDKNNPLGPAPENPENDQQFINWESAVLEWGRNTIWNFSEYNKPISQGIIPHSTSDTITESKTITIERITPENGSFISNSFTVQADIASRIGLKRIEFYFNNQLINALAADVPSYRYAYTISNPIIKDQNIITIKAVDKSDKEFSVEQVVFRKK